jgi:hypothetical protein
MLLTKEDTGFLLWCLGHILGLSEKMDKAHRKYIEKHHDEILPKIIKLHEEKGRT